MIQVTPSDHASEPQTLLVGAMGGNSAALTAPGEGARATQRLPAIVDNRRARDTPASSGSSGLLVHPICLLQFDTSTLFLKCVESDELC